LILHVWESGEATLFFVRGHAREESFFNVPGRAASVAFIIEWKPVMEGASNKDRIIKAVQETADELEYMVYEASVVLRGENSRVIVKIDHLRGISHQDCEMFSRSLARRLDSMDVLPNYSLEISSPGLDRKIRTVEEYRRFTGAPVKIVFHDGDMKKAIKGTISAVSKGSVDIQSEEGDRTIEFSAIVSANLSY